MSLTITQAATPEDREAVFRLRYTMLVEEEQKPSPLADHPSRSLEEPMDATARFLIARYDDAVVGALRVNLLCEGDWGGEAALLHLDLVREAQPHATAISSAPLVSAGFRTTTVPLWLAASAYEMNLREGVTHDFVAAHREQQPFYRSLGYRDYCGWVRHPERGDVLPMVLALRDRAHLEAIASPLAEHARERKAD